MERSDLNDPFSLLSLSHEQKDQTGEGRGAKVFPALETILDPLAGEMTVSECLEMLTLQMHQKVEGQ